MPADYKKMKMLRRSRVVWGSWALWKPRIVFWAGALAIGVISVGFARAADAAQHLFKAATAVHPLAYLLPLLLTPAGFVLCSYLAARLFPNSQGSGIPQAIAARHLNDDLDRAFSEVRAVVAAELLRWDRRPGLFDFVSGLLDEKVG